MSLGRCLLTALLLCGSVMVPSAGWGQAGFPMTTHPAIYQRYLDHNDAARTVTLSKGTCWVVRPKDVSKLRNWMPLQDDVVIAPLSQMFNAYHFRLINVVTQQELQANLAPEQTAAAGALAVDWVDGAKLLLSDGTLWDIAYADRGALRRWRPGDAVLIGINDGWYCLTSPNIVVHLPSNTFIRGCCIEAQ